MKQAKKTQKENKKLAKALQNSADRPRDKENTGVNAVVESILALQALRVYLVAQLHHAVQACAGRPILRSSPAG